MTAGESCGLDRLQAAEWRRSKRVDGGERRRMEAPGRDAVVNRALRVPEVLKLRGRDQLSLASAELLHPPLAPRPSGPFLRICRTFGPLGAHSIRRSPPPTSLLPSQPSRGPSPPAC